MTEKSWEIKWQIYKEKHVVPRGEPWGTPLRQWSRGWESIIESEIVKRWRLKWAAAVRDTQQKEALLGPWGEMVVINVSLMSQTSGGSCSMDLSETLCPVGWHSSVGISLHFPNRPGFPIHFSLKPGHKLMENKALILSAPSDDKEAVAFHTNKSSSGNERWCRHQQIFTLVWKTGMYPSSLCFITIHTTLGLF